MGRNRYQTVDAAKPAIVHLPTNPEKIGKYPITEKTKLLNIASTSAELNQQYDGGWSVGTIRRLIPKWRNGYHYVKAIGGYRFNLDAIREWIVSTAKEQ